MISQLLPAGGTILTVPTGEGKQLVANVYCSIVLMLVKSILPPILQ